MISYFYMTIAGILITLSFTNPQLYFLVWIAFLPVVAALKNKNLKQAFTNGWLLGIIIMIGSAYWLYYPLLDFSGLPRFFIIVILALLFILMGLFYACWALIFVYVNGKSKIHPFLLACSWVAIEFLRLKFLPGFPLGFIAYTQTGFKSLIQLTDIGGMFLVTFVVILINGYLYKLLQRKRIKFIIPILIIIIIILSYGGYKYTHYNNKEYSEISVGVINTMVAQENKWKSSWIDKNIDKITTGAREFKDVSLIIGPETSLTFDIIRNGYYRKRFLKRVNEIDKYIQVGAQSIKENKKGKYNSVFLISPQGKIIDRYNKRRLVPFGEYIPFNKTLDLLSQIDVESLQAGEMEKYFQTASACWSTSICSEIFYPLLYSGDFDFLINHSNEAWYRESNLHQQMWSAAVLRAIEYRCSVVRAGNYSWSGLILPSGSYDNIYKQGENVTLKVKINNESTLFQKWGKHIIWGAVIIIILSLVIRIYLNRN